METHNQQEIAPPGSAEPSPIERPSQEPETAPQELTAFEEKAENPVGGSLYVTNLSRLVIEMIMNHYIIKYIEMSLLITCVRYSALMAR